MWDCMLEFFIDNSYFSFYSSCERYFKLFISLSFETNFDYKSACNSDIEDNDFLDNFSYSFFNFS